jgi:hypothetical protein
MTEPKAFRMRGLVNDMRWMTLRKFDPHTVPTSTRRRKTEMFDKVRSLRRVFGVVVLLAGVMSAACTSMGAGKLVSSHTAYNDAVQLTVTREVLANIVRSRYSDPMQFLTVSAINAQFSVNVGGSAVIAGIGAAGTTGEAGGTIGYSDSPTITFLPQSDNAFYNSLHSSFEVSEVIALGQLYRSAQAHPGWQALSLGFSFASINGADDFFGGQYNPLYRQRVDALVQLLRRGASYRQVPEWDFDTSAMAKEKVTGEDRLKAFKDGLYFIEEDNGKKLRLARYRMVLALTLPARNDPDVISALKVLGVTPGGSRYTFRPPTHAAPGFVDRYAIWVTPRSMIDVINLAGHFVDVPLEHEGIVPPIERILRESSEMLSVRIHSSKEEPPFPYRVQHRGFWFYVDDTERDSKVFLEVMVAAYTSRVGSRQAGEGQPQVVLPVGG